MAYGAVVLGSPAELLYGVSALQAYVVAVCASMHGHVTGGSLGVDFYLLI